MARPRMVKFRDMYAKKRYDSVYIREIAWGLTFEKWYSLVTSSCHYCGRPPFSKTKGKNSGVFYGGIDRISNKSHYIDSNVLPCCAECNYIRGFQMSVEETEVVIKALWKHRNGKRNIQKGSKTSKDGKQ